MLKYDNLDITRFHSYYISRTNYGKNVFRFSVSGGDHPHDPDGHTEWLSAFDTEDEAIDYIKNRRKADLLLELTELVTKGDPKWLVDMAIQAKLNRPLGPQTI